MRTTVSIALLAVAAGCSSPPGQFTATSKSISTEARNTDSLCIGPNWFTIGQEDGQTGEPPERVRDYEKQCGALGVTVDARMYAAGYEQGQRKYCEPQQAYELGRRGIPTRAICPGGSEAVFQSNYERGLTRYCTSESAFKLGRSRETYRGTCPKSLEPGVIRGFASGRQLTELEAKLAEATAEIDSTTRSLQFFKDKDKRDVLIDKLRRIRKERKAAQKEIDALRGANGLAEDSSKSAEEL